MLDVDPDARMPITTALTILDAAVALTGDPDLGLRAASCIDPGHYDVIEYAAGSAATWREALELVLRFIRLVNDAADFSIAVSDGRAALQLGSMVPLAHQRSILCAAVREWT